MTTSEMQNYQEGKIKWNSLKIENILQGVVESTTIRRPSLSNDDGKTGRKREVEKKAEPIKKKPRTEADDLDVTSESAKRLSVAAVVIVLISFPLLSWYFDIPCFI
ncbi:hypothetical protein COOONC_23750 [Cooperia oncophora]